MAAMIFTGPPQFEQCTTSRSIPRTKTLAKGRAGSAGGLRNRQVSRRLIVFSTNGSNLEIRALTVMCKVGLGLFDVCPTREAMGGPKAPTGRR